MLGGNFLHLIKTLLKIEKPITQTSAPEQELIKKYTKNKLTAVEIGVFEAVNTALIAESLNDNGKLYAIDPFFKVSLGFSYQKIISYKNIKRAHQQKKLVWLEGLSNEIIDKVPTGIDFIFIDGDHRFEAVKKDFELYQKKLSKDGVIAIHDAALFDNGWTKADWGPVRLVNEIIIPSGKWKIVEKVDSLVIVKAMIV